MKSVYLFSFLFLLISCSQNSKKQANSPLNNYQEYAGQLITLIKNGGDAKAISSKANNLIEISRSIYKDLKKSRIECNSYIDFVIAHIPKMITSSLEDIEDKYHGGTALPDTDHDHCVEAKELVVHPATVVVLASEKFNKAGKEQMIDEMNEVLEHLDDFRK